MAENIQQHWVGAAWDIPEGILFSNEEFINNMNESLLDVIILSVPDESWRLK